MEFYEGIYLPDHASPLNRWVHFLSKIAALACFSLASTWVPGPLRG